MYTIPGTLLNSVIDTVLNAGTYYLKVEGKGNLVCPCLCKPGLLFTTGNSFRMLRVLPLYRLELHGAQNGDKHQLKLGY